MPIAHFERRAIEDVRPGDPIPNLRAYWKDPEAQQRFAAERQAHYDRANASIDAAMLRVKGGRVDD